MTSQRPISSAVLLAFLAIGAAAAAENVNNGVADPTLVGAAPAAESKQVLQTAYADLVPPGSPPAMSPSAASSFTAPSMSAPVYYPPATPPADQPISAASSPGQFINTNPDWDSGEPVRYRTDGWYSQAELIITQAHITRSDFGSWPDDEAAAGRFILGHEDPRGYGGRGRFWIFDQQDVEAFSETAGIQAWTFQFDAYKRFYIDDGDLMIGAGPVLGDLELTGELGSSRFKGAGISLFGEAYYPLGIKRRLEVGWTARARISMLSGNWDDSSSGDIVPSTDGDTMSITELQWGPELRWTFGSHTDHQLVLSSYIEHQRWQSEWMGEFTRSAISFTGVSLNAGVRW